MTNPNHSKHFLQFRTGSLNALQCYYDRYIESVYLFFLNATGDETTAWEKAQQVFVRLYNRRRKIKEEAQIPSFLYRIMKDLARTTHQDEYGKKMPAAGLPSAHMTRTQLPAGRRAEAIKDDLLEKLAWAVRALPAKKREILQLYFSEKRSVRDIAMQLNIKEQTVRNHQSQSMKVLRKKLKRYEEEINLFFS